nr:annexin D3-like [Ipomoea batatas]
MSLRFTSLTFEWKAINILSELPKLKVLRLSDCLYCIGDEWELLAEENFNQLICLEIAITYLEHWEASACHFPNLQHLVLKGCPRLVKIPADFADIMELKSIKLDCCLPSAVDSAKEIQEQQHEYGNDNMVVIEEDTIVDDDYSLDLCDEGIEIYLKSKRKEAVILWTYEPPERDARLVNKALKSMKELKEGIEDLQVIVEIACASSPHHLVAVRRIYCSLFDCSIEEDIMETISLPLNKVVRASVLGLGTNEDSLTRAIVTRAEIDLAEVRGEYEKITTSSSLDQAVADDTSGDYRDFFSGPPWCPTLVSSFLRSSYEDERD